MGREELLRPLRIGRSVIVSTLHGSPGRAMLLIGVTGTDGKTTTSSLIYHILSSCGKKVGLISTVAAKIFNGEQEIAIDTGSHVTTPDSFSIQRLLKQMKLMGCDIVVIECTSHALVQERLAGTNFDIGVITNITHEHLDYHKTYERYVLAKSLLFRRDRSFYARKPKMSCAILNHDDKSWELLQSSVQQWDVLSYGTSDFSQYKIVDPTYTAVGASYILLSENAQEEVVDRYEITSSLVGDYNVHNATAALLAAHKAGIPLAVCVSALSTFKTLEGRYELVASPSDSHGTIIVDFAHTPNALRKVLSFTRGICKGRLIVVFGCASERDVVKRPMMGKIAGEHADITILTAEDPRRERAEDINAQIIPGLLEAGAEEFPFASIGELSSEQARMSLSEHFPLFLNIPDREAAILAAVAISEKDDIVLVCGKGHEKTMCIGTVETPWSDQESVQRAVQKVG